MTNFSSLPSRFSHGRREHALGSHITTFVRYHLRKLNSKYKVQQSQQTHLDISHAHLCLTTANSTTLYTIQALIIYIYTQHRLLDTIQMPLYIQYTRGTVYIASIPDIIHSIQCTYILAIHYTPPTSYPRQTLLPFLFTPHLRYKKQ